MTLTNSRATIGLQTRFTPTNTGVLGQIPIGENNQNILYPYADSAYSLQVFFSNGGEDCSFNPLNGLVFSPSSSWVAGTAQVEYILPTGQASANGDITITITSNLFYPAKSFVVPILSGEINSDYTPKIVAALKADTTISFYFDVDGSTDFTLTRKPQNIIQGSNISVNYYSANDSTLNIAIAAGSTGINSITTSTNQVAGVATSGVLVVDGDGKDIEGETLPTATPIAILYKCLGDNDGFKVSTPSDASELAFQLSGHGIAFFSYPMTYYSSQKIEAIGQTALQITAIGS